MDTKQGPPNKGWAFFLVNQRQPLLDISYSFASSRANELPDVNMGVSFFEGSLFSGEGDSFRIFPMLLKFLFGGVMSNGGT